MATEKTIINLLAEVSVLYPLMVSITPEMTAIWASYLIDIPDDLLKNALRHYVATAKDNYPPTVPALRKASSDLKRSAANVPTSFEAWENLLTMGDGSPVSRVVEENGKFYIEHHERLFSHHIVQTVARQLGWPDSFPGDNPEADRAHFFKAYDSEIAKMMEQDRELPAVRDFVERQRIEVSDEIRKLTDKLSHPRLEA